MLKIIISVYIAAVLLFAGFADASTTTKFQRLDGATVWLNVTDAQFNSNKEILILAGKVSPECLATIRPVLNLDQKTNQILVSVTAEGKDCLTPDSNYEVAIDLKAFFSEHALAQDTHLHFIIDNYSGDKNASFDYLAKQEVQYSFDTVLDGKIEWNQQNGKFYLSAGRTKIQILSRLDLSNYVNNVVQLKGLIPNNFTIGNNVNPLLSQLIVSQLIALK
jgi:hypothetical protein